MNLLKPSTLLITVAITILLINGCATQTFLKNEETEIKPLGCASKNFPKSWNFDEDSSPVVTYKPSAIYISMFKPILSIPFKNNKKLLIVDLSNEYQKILEEISSSQINSAVKSISVNILNRIALDNTRSDYFVLDVFLSKPVVFNSYNGRGGPKLYKDSDGSFCYSFGTHKGGWSVPLTAKIEILENYVFSSHEWIPIFQNNKYDIDLNFHHTQQERKYSNSLPARILLTPFAFVFDVITFPIQLFVGVSGLR